MEPAETTHDETSHMNNEVLPKPFREGDSAHMQNKVAERGFVDPLNDFTLVSIIGGHINMFFGVRPNRNLL